VVSPTYSQFASRNPELSMYFASKAVETIFRIGVDRKLVKPLKYGDILLFSVSMGILFFGSIFEPHNIRASYFQMLIKFGCGQFDHMDKRYKETIKQLSQ